MDRIEAESPESSTCRSVSTTLLVVVLLFFAVPIRIEPPVSSTNGDNHSDPVFVVYMKTFNKTYRDNDTLKSEKYVAFTETLKEIESLNSNREFNSSAKFGFTKFSDLSKAEFKNIYLQNNLNVRDNAVYLKMPRLKSGRYSHKIQKRAAGDLPLKVDWRERNILTKIKNQKDCGACWAFSTLETIESMYALKYGNLQELSVQELIDCARFNNNGCEGGDICTLLYWLDQNSIAIRTDSQYPLKWRSESCGVTKKMEGVKVSNFSCDEMFVDETELLEMLAKHGPVAVAVNALMWQNYLGGVIRYHCDSEPWLMNHAVQLVGYDLTAEIPHYIARNSWGTDYGDGGYLYLAIGGNTCGVANEVVSLDIL